MPHARDGQQAILRRYAIMAPRYDRLWRSYSEITLSQAERLILTHAPPAARLLDVACGTGLLAERFRRSRPAMSLTGIDLSPAMLAQARARLPERPGLRWVEGGADQLPFEDSAFDALTCTNAFHLVPDQPRALAEFRRVLAPGGLLIILDWDRSGWTMSLLNRGYRLLGRAPRRILTADELNALAARAGFELLERSRVSAGWFWRLNAMAWRR